MDYVVTNAEENGKYYFESSSDFLNWFLEEKPIQKKFKFENVDDIENLYLFLIYYDKIKSLVEEKVLEFNDSLNDDNLFIKEALNELSISNSGGKYLRGVLVSLGYNSFGKEDNDYLSLSLALEIFQTSILIHDDIIDLSSKRRGTLTIPFRYKKRFADYDMGNIADSMALCLGDLGFYEANKILVNNYYDSPYLSLLLNYYNDVAIKTCKGEMIDVILPFYEKNGFDVPDLENNIIQIYKLKTAWYSVIGPFVLGSILAGATSSEVKELEDALINLGVAYQIKDDLLGIFGNEEQIGKSSFSDSAEFKQTILYSYAINTEYKTELLNYYGRCDLDTEGLKKIRKIFEDCGSKKYALDMMERLFRDSVKKIEMLDFSANYKKIVLGFCEFLKARGK